MQHQWILCVQCLVEVMDELGRYDVVIYDEIEFSKTKVHSMKMLVADPAASSHNKFRIQLDYMTFEPIIEDE